jgi:hypothetical protein
VALEAEVLVHLVQVLRLLVLEIKAQVVVVHTDTPVLIQVAQVAQVLSFLNTNFNRN